MAVPAYPIHEIAGQMRKYDGRSDAHEFMSRFKYDLRTYGLSLEWALRNFDRVLEGKASSWWSSKWHNISTELDGCNTPDEIEIVFNNNEADFYAFFDNNAQESIYRRQNKSLKFKLGVCPTKYITDKLKVLRLIDPNMTENKKVAQIIKGLPYDLRQTMV